MPDPVTPSPGVLVARLERLERLAPMLIGVRIGVAPGGVEIALGELSRRYKAGRNSSHDATDRRSRHGETRLRLAQIGANAGFFRHEPLRQG
jgi:hypothetical protein